MGKIVRHCFKQYEIHRGCNEHMPSWLVRHARRAKEKRPVHGHWPALEHARTAMSHRYIAEAAASRDGLALWYTQFSMGPFPDCTRAHDVRSSTASCSSPVRTCRHHLLPSSTGRRVVRVCRSVQGMRAGGQQRACDVTAPVTQYLTGGVGRRGESRGLRSVAPQLPRRVHAIPPRPEGAVGMAHHSAALRTCGRQLPQAPCFEQPTSRPARGVPPHLEPPRRTNSGRPSRSVCRSELLRKLLLPAGSRRAVPHPRAPAAGLHRRGIYLRRRSSTALPTKAGRMNTRSAPTQQSTCPTPPKWRRAGRLPRTLFRRFPPARAQRAHHMLQFHKDEAQHTRCCDPISISYISGG